MQIHDPYRHYRMNGHAGRANSGVVPGLILVSIGALVFLNNLHIVYLREWLQYWPAILIAAGLVKLIDSTALAGRVGGGVLIAGGAILLARNLGYIDVRARDLWPLALIAVGLIMLFQRTINFQDSWANFGNRVSEAGALNECAVFGGGKRRIVTSDFKGGTVCAVFGGFEVDLTRAEMAADSAVLQLDAIFGGIELRIPAHWTLDLQGVGIFGGYGDETMKPDDRAPGVKRLIVKGTAVFGGVVVKS